MTEEEKYVEEFVEIHNQSYSQDCYSCYDWVMVFHLEELGLIVINDDDTVSAVKKDE